MSDGKLLLIAGGALALLLYVGFVGHSDGYLEGWCQSRGYTGVQRSWGRWVWDRPIICYREERSEEEAP